jgi:GT2 family glycosyltransferase
MIHFIIPEYGFRSMTEECINSIVQNCHAEKEIWVGDGGYYHGSEPLCGGVHLLTYEENTGYSGITNRIVRDASPAAGDFLALCNNDVLIHRGCIERLIEVAAPGAFAGPSIIVPPQYAGVTAHPQMHEAEIDITGIEQLDMISTALMVLRYSDWLTVGGIDEACRHYFTDDILCIEGAAHGIPSLWVKDAWIDHKVGVSFRGWKFANEQVKRDRVIFEGKYPNIIWSPSGRYGRRE